MHSQRSSPPDSMPTVLAIGVSAKFLPRHTEAVAICGAVLTEASLIDAAQVTFARRPAVLMMTEDVYAFDPERFDSLAEMTSASIAIIADERDDTAEVALRAARALAESERLRQRKSMRETIPVGMGSGARRLDGPSIKQAKKRSA